MSTATCKLCFYSLILFIHNFIVQSWSLSEIEITWQIACCSVQVKGSKGAHTCLYAAFEAISLSLKPIVISSTTSIPELCTESVLSVKVPLSLVIFALQSSVKVKWAWVHKIINWNMQTQRQTKRVYHERGKTKTVSVVSKMNI